MIARERAWDREHTGAGQANPGGAISVRTSTEQRASLVAHLLRVASNVGRQAMASTTAEGADGWRDLALQLGWEDDGDWKSGPSGLAARVGGHVLIVCEAKASRVGDVLRAQLEMLAADPKNDLLLIQLSDEHEAGHAVMGGEQECAQTYHLDEISETDLNLWWQTAIQSAGVTSERRFGGLVQLEDWWSGVQSVSNKAACRTARASLAASRTWQMLHAAQYALSEQTALAVAVSACRLDEAADELPKTEEGQARAILRELTDLGLVDQRFGRYILRGELHEPIEVSALRALAVVLAETSEPWAQFRAAELRIQARRLSTDEELDLGDIEKLALRAVDAVHDRALRDDFWQRWIQVLGELQTTVPLQTEVERGLWARSAERALLLGDGDRAHQMATRALSLDGAAFDVLLLHGRSCHTRGDLTTAVLSLSRALSTACGEVESAQAAVMMSQVRFAAGDREQARRFAEKAIDSLEAGEKSANLDVRLTARNVLGKLLLADEHWNEAEAHFAEDAYQAAIAGLVEAELRARLNRAVAYLYLGRRSQAQTMVEAVLKEGENQRVPNAVAFALSNLATIAIMEQRYVDALAHSERAIDVRYAIGSRLGFIRSISNLAELRAQLGLVDEAEAALRFGGRACGVLVSSSRRAFFGKAEARIHLERGETTAARRAAEDALAAAKCIGEQSVLAQCHRLLARIALDDGDICLAEDSLGRAVQFRQSAYGLAEAALLRAATDRAAGAPFETSAERALAAARKADDLESGREARVLLFHARKSDNDIVGARRHLDAACESRDRVVATLPAELQSRFLARASSRLLDDLRSQVIGAERTPSTGLGPLGGARRGAASRSAEVDGVCQKRRLIGESDSMQALRASIARIAPSEASVLVQGETGTGKELIAEAIHYGSRRYAAPLVKVNCAALVETLLLSELFGHEKGAFTGASARRQGRFELADGGTLFLDEIGDISPRTQAALLRILQEGTYERVGGSTTLRADVRVICATHRDLQAMVQRGEFREDLYYRLCGITVQVPPLRERRGDLGVLCSHLLARLCVTSGIEPRQVEPSALAALSRHDWPGNVRELENALRVAALFARDESIRIEDFQQHVANLRHLGDSQARSSAPGSGPISEGPVSRKREAPHSANMPLSMAPNVPADLVYAEIRDGIGLADMKRKLERECIERALVEAGGNITRAARLLGMKRPRLSQLVKQYDLATVLEEIKS